MDTPCVTIPLYSLLLLDTSVISSRKVPGNFSRETAHVGKWNSTISLPGINHSEKPSAM